MRFDTLENKQRSASILIVEDSPGDVMMMMHAFKHAKLPYELTVVSSAEKALSVLRQEGDYTDAARPDIILLDLNLPKMNGKDFLNIVKRDAAFRRIPIMVLSSSSAEHDVMMSYDLHANSYIVKPASLDESIAVIEKVEQFWFTLAILPQPNSAAMEQA